jgi:hypothetical protein
MKLKQALQRALILIYLLTIDSHVQIKQVRRGIYKVVQI